MDVNAVCVGISRLRKRGFVLDGTPYRPSKSGKEQYENALAEAGITQ